MFIWISKRKQQEQERERTAEFSRTWLDGYNAGYRSGKQDGLMVRIIPNEMSEFLGLQPIKESEE